MQACAHFPSKANPLAVYLKEICSCVVSAGKEFHTIEMQFIKREEKNIIMLVFFPDDEKPKILALPNQSLAVLKFSCNKPTQIHLMSLYKEYYCIEKAFFLHHFHHSSVCAAASKGRVHPGLIQSRVGSRWGREWILPLCTGGTPPAVLLPALGAMALLKQVWWRATNIITSFHLLWKQPEMAGLFHPGQKKATEDFIHWAFQYLQEACRKGGENF